MPAANRTGHSTIQIPSTMLPITDAFRTPMNPDLKLPSRATLPLTSSKYPRLRKFSTGITDSSANPNTIDPKPKHQPTADDTRLDARRTHPPEFRPVDWIASSPEVSASPASSMTGGGVDAISDSALIATSIDDDCQEWRLQGFLNNETAAIPPNFSGNPSPPRASPPLTGMTDRALNALKNGGFLLVLTVCAGAVMNTWFQPHPLPAPPHPSGGEWQQAGFTRTVDEMDRAFSGHWTRNGLQPVERAPDLALARRLSLALTGTVPSLPEIRAFERQPPERRVQWWLSHLFQDRRTSDYLAERFARACVGVENGPFLVYRRRRMVDWLSDELHDNRPYDEIVRSLVADNGTWTSRPQVNFITVSIDQNNDRKGPDEVKLAARSSRAFLGVSIDCVQCHDDKFGDRWKQEDFHQLAAFFASAENSLTGVRDNPAIDYEFRFKGEREERRVPRKVPFHEALLPESGTPRERLAQWITHPANDAFTRATVNRVWALLFNRPLSEPIDDIPLEGPHPPGMKILAEDFVRHGFDLRHLIRIIASTRVFQLDSRSLDPAVEITEAHEEHWAAFPLTRLRPEQVAGSVIQAASLDTIDAESHIVLRLARTVQQGGFIKRYGDFGEDEFGGQSATVPQRLLLMNGEMVGKRTGDNLFMNASSRIAALAPTDETAVETAYLTAFTRRPTEPELSHFTGLLKDTREKQRGAAMEDLYWTLINSTEFSWNH